MCFPKVKNKLSLTKINNIINLELNLKASQKLFLDYKANRNCEAETFTFILIFVSFMSYSY